MIGKYPDAVGERDAFHMACVAVTCEVRLEPGDPIKFVSYSRNEVEKCDRSERQGIVDPFLDDTVHSEQPFWMCLTPGSTKKLTHSFKIDDEPESWEDEEDRRICRDMGCG